MKRLCFFLAAALSGLTSAASGAGFSEPHITIYGKVTNSLTSLQVYNGALQWTFTPPGADPFVVEGALENLDSGAFSYQLEVPVEKIPAGFLLSESTVEASATTRDYSMSVTLDGQAAELVASDGQPHPGSLTFAELFRGNFERIDLRVASGDPSLDSDNDIMTDVWEVQFGLNPNDDEDAMIDSDNDGEINVVEFLNGTDPRCVEYVKWLATHNLIAAGSAMSGFYADPDEDGLANGYEYGLNGDPRTPDANDLLQSLQEGFVEEGAARYLSLSVTLPGNRQCNVDYVVEASQDMMTWKSIEDVDVKTLVADEATLMVRDVQNVNAPETKRCFLRLRVAEPLFVASAVREPVSLPLQLANTEIQVPTLDAQIEEYYHTHQSDFIQPTTIRLAKVSVAWTPEMSDSLQAAQWGKIEAARGEALALPADVEHFGSVAVQYSEDQATRYRGGVIGTFIPGMGSSQVIADTVNGLFELEQGAISEVMAEQGKLAIYKVIEITAERQQTLAEVEPIIRSKVISAR